jgi:transcriptional regulator with XRE-family HTH domain
MAQKFKNALRYHRKILGLTLKEVAKMLKHKNVSRLSKWEHGISAPNLHNLLKLSIVYKTLIDQFYPEIRAALLKKLSTKSKESFKSKTK